MQVTYDFSGKSALLIGGTTGIGAETARRLHSKGANVALVGLEPDLLEGLAEEAADGEGERQRRQVPAGLDRVDRLSRDAKLLGESALTQATTLPQLSHLVRHAVKLACHPSGVKDLCHPDAGRSVRRMPDAWPVR